MKRLDFQNPSVSIEEKVNAKTNFIKILNVKRFDFFVSD